MRILQQAQALSLLLISLFLVTACGGGGGGGGGGTPSTSDSTPDAFRFTDQTDVVLNAVIESNAITVSGIDTATSISISTGEYRIDGGAFTSTAGSVTNAQNIHVRQPTSNSLNTTSTLTLTIGEVMGTFSVTTIIVDNNAPKALIRFPPALSSTEVDSITVRGTANDAEGSEITVLRVNGVDATSSDNFATWQVNVPLVPGSNALTVETGDIALNTDATAANAVIENEALLSYPRSMVLDSANNRVLVVDSVLKALLAVDLSSGKRTVLSNSSTGTSTAPCYLPFFGPISVALDGDRAVVVDSVVDRLVAVDLSTGNRTCLSSRSTGTGPDFRIPQSVALDGDRALVVDEVLDALLAVDLSNGNRTILSGDFTGTGPDFGYLQSVALDGSLALVLDKDLNALLVIDLVTGDRVILSK